MILAIISREITILIYHKITSQTFLKNLLSFLVFRSFLPAYRSQRLFFHPDLCRIFQMEVFRRRRFYELQNLRPLRPLRPRSQSEELRKLFFPIPKLTPKAAEFGH